MSYYRRSRQAKFHARGTPGGHMIRIGGERLNIHFARIKYLCIHCLGELRIKNFGLKCTLNDTHYGFIRNDEAKKITQEVRFMKISKMFPSEYVRGIDIERPIAVTIKSVVGENIRDRDTGEMIKEYVIRFKEIPKKLRLGITMAKTVAEILNDEDGDSDNWVGGRVTIFSRKEKHFGKIHLVPRLRKAKQGDSKPGVLHWAEDEKKRAALAQTLAKKDIPITDLFAAYDVLDWAGLVGIKDTGQVAYAKANEYWQAQQPPPAEEEEPSDVEVDNFVRLFYQDVLTRCELYQSVAEIETVMKYLGLGQNFLVENPEAVFDALDKHAKSVAAEELKDAEPV